MSVNSQEIIKVVVVKFEYANNHLLSNIITKLTFVV